MKQGIGLLLVTLGAILRYAIDDNWDAADMSVIGLILMIVGGVAFVTDVLLELAKRRGAAPTTPTPAHSPLPPATPPATQQPHQPPK